MEIKMSALQIHTVTLSMKVNFKHLISWETVNLVSLESKCFLRLRLGKHRDSRETNFTVLQRTSH